MNRFYSQDDNSDYYFEKIKVYISSHANLDLKFYRDKYIHRRIYYRLQRLNLKTYKLYLNYLVSNQSEPQIFKKFFTIHVTEFFRDEKPFRYLENILLQKISKSKKITDRTIRILSAPCSTGEEPYSVSIIYEFLKKKGKISNPIEIYACDIDDVVVDFAKMGIYPGLSLKNISIQSIQRNFVKNDENRYSIAPSVKQNVNFFIHDLLKPLPNELKFDLIICRNFMIYISKKHQRIVIDNLLKNMNPHGYFMLGKTEGFPLLNTKHFQVENVKEHIYQYISSNSED